MPHVSPLSWLLIPLIMWTLLLSIMSIFWWHQYPIFKMNHSFSTSSNSLSWNWK